MAAALLCACGGEPDPAASATLVTAFDKYAAGETSLALNPAFVDGWPGAYFTTEIWIGFKAVWFQPLYVAIIGFAADGTPQHAPGQKPVFAVGHTHRFYSGLVKVQYYRVPAGAPADVARSAREVLDKGFPLFPGPNALAPLVPEGMLVNGAMPDGRPGALAEALPAPEKAWLDGKQVTFLDGGASAFVADGTVIRPSRFYLWHVRGADGTLSKAGLPNVGTPSPNVRFADGASERVPEADPAYGHLWRLYSAVLPSYARAFAKAEDADPGIDKGSPAIAKNFGRVAANPSCFKNGDDSLTDCEWIDTEAKLKRHVPPEDIRELPILASCPLLVYRERTLRFPPITP